MVEPDIESIKCVMGLEHLRGQSPEALEREIWTGMLTYNLVQLKILQSGYAAGREFRNTSFTETHQLLSTNWLRCGCVGVKDSVAVAYQRQGTSAIISNRPGRSEPRENKRRPKVLKLMTVPRQLFSCGAGVLFKTPVIRRGQRHSCPSLHFNELRNRETVPSTFSSSNPKGSKQVAGG